MSGAILDIALGEDEPPLTINVVHPHPVEWEALMRPISNALFAKNITVEPLPLVPSAEWYHRLEKYAINANEGKIKRVVCFVDNLSLDLFVNLHQIQLALCKPAIKLLNYLSFFVQGDQHSGDTKGGQADYGSMLAFKYSTEVAERASKTMRELPRISTSDVTRWVDYWKFVRWFRDVGDHNP